MTFRILPDGTIETDKLADALSVRDAIRGRRVDQRRVQSESNGSSGVILSSATSQFLAALMRAPAGLTSDEVARAAEIRTGNIPPIIRELNSWARKEGITLTDLMHRERGFERGRPISTYRLSEQGLALFSNLTGVNQDAVGEKHEHDDSAPHGE